MPQPAAVDEMRTMSFDELRKRLESGFEQLLAMLPKGDEPALDCEYYSMAGQPTGRFVPGDPEHNLHLLRDFATIIRALRSTGGYPPDRVLEIMRDYGGANLTLIEVPDALLQQFID